MRRRILLQAALNGNRIHAATPRSPEALAAEARAAVAAGAAELHIHPHGADGRETFDPDACAAALRAVRSACPGVPISLSTSATIIADPRERLRIIAGWHEMPDLVSANQGEDGIAELCEMLIARGVGIEAGLLCFEDAQRFVASGLPSRCRRALVEAPDLHPEAAMRHAEAMEDVVLAAGLTLEQVHHGEGIASWAVNRRAIARGHGIRTGLEDVTVLPDGRPAAGNGDLVRAAAAIIAESADRSVAPG